MEGIYVHGISGETTAYLVPEKDLGRLKPKLVVINLGTNYLCNGTLPLKVGTKLVDMAKGFSMKLQTRTLICSVLHRGPRAVKHVKRVLRKSEFDQRDPHELLRGRR